VTQAPSGHWKIEVEDPVVNYKMSKVILIA
jgi:hypothetical protein